MINRTVESDGRAVSAFFRIMRSAGWLCVGLIGLSIVSRSDAADANEQKPKITGVYPAISYPSSGQTNFDLRVFGEYFGADTNELTVSVSGEGKLPLQWVENAADAKGPGPFGILVSPRQIDLKGIRRFPGLRKATIQVERGDKLSEPYTFVLSTVPRHWPGWIALVASVILLGWPIFMLERGFRRETAIPPRVDSTAQEPARERGGFSRALRALLLDNETGTYSLSKFQFYAWTGAAIFGYVYLTAATSLIQGVFEFADIPKNLPGILLVSGSTTALALGITNSRGPKGSGPIEPSFADFITTGGVVAPERFQFFVWTILGVIAFLFLLLIRDPGDVRELPTVPAGFLYSMGVRPRAHR